MPVISEIDQELLERVKRQYDPNDLGKILKRVRQFTAKAEAEIAPGATPEERAAALKEQELARGMADALMFAFGVSQAMAEASMPIGARSKPGVIRVSVGKWNSDLSYHLIDMVSAVARHCRCKARNYAEQDPETGETLSRVYGFESDLRYFEILYTTLRLHMLGAFLPKVEDGRSLDENCYRLHEAGYNWLEIAEIYGWRKVRGVYLNGIKAPYRNKETDELWPATKVGGIYKRAYLRECKRLGVEPAKISARSSEAYRRCAAEGYMDRLRQRLREVEGNRDESGGAGIVLRTRYEDVLEFFRQDNPDMFAERETYEPPPPCPKCEKNPSGTCREHPAGRAYRAPAYSAAGYAAGVRHADTADISGGNRTAGGQQRALG